MATIWNASQATAVAAILAALPTYIGTNEHGQPYIKKEELRNWLVDQFALVFADAKALPTNEYDIENVYGNPPNEMDAIINRLVDAYDPERFRNEAGWPLTKTAQDKEELVNQISRLQVTAQSAAVAIVNYYEDKVRSIRPKVEQWFAANVLNKKSSEPGGFPDGVERVVDTRVYAATYVTNWGEESALSDPSPEITVDGNDTVVVTVPTAPSGYNVSSIRLYRSSTGSNATDFQFVKEQAIGSGYAITDDVPSTQLGETCPTKNWRPPPSNDANLHPTPYEVDRKDLQGLVALPNGIHVGFFDNTLCFSEAYTGYAWPPQYRLPLEHPIVGLGVFGQTVFVGTRANPYFVSGVDSASMSAQKLEHNQACLSRRSIVSSDYGVLYASPDGLCLADSSGVKVISEKRFSKDDWMALVPSSIFGAVHDNVYYAFYNTGTTTGCYAFDLVTGNVSTLSLNATAVFVDKVTDTMYAASGTSIAAVFGSTTKRTGRWKGKIWRLPSENSFAWLHVDSDFSAPVTVRIYADGVLWHTATVTSASPVRLPAGRYQEWQIDVETSATVTSVLVTSETRELQSV